VKVGADSDVKDEVGAKATAVFAALLVPSHHDSRIKDELTNMTGFTVKEDDGAGSEFGCLEKVEVTSGDFFI
jgi:hypothetical protein